MSDEQLYRVAFSGAITGEFDLDATKSRFSRLFKLSADRTEKLFSGKEFILKDNVSEDVAMNFAIRIAETGCECYIEPVMDPSLKALLAEGDRRNGERRTRYRRSPRKGAAPDRRVMVGRRREDKRHADDIDASGTDKQASN